MSKFKKIAGSLGVILGFVVLVGATNEAWNQYQLNVVKPATVGGDTTGTPEKLGQLTVETTSASRKGVVIKAAASQTADMLEIVNSSGTEIFGVDKDGDVSVNSFSTSGNIAGENIYCDNTTIADVVARFDGTSGQTADLFVVNSVASVAAVEEFSIDADGDVEVSDSVYIDGSNTDDVQLRVDATQNQAVDILQVRLYDTTEILALDADGDAELSNSLLIDGADAADEQLVVQAHASQSANIVDIENSAGTTFVSIDSSGNLACAQGLNGASKSSDPCGTLPVGSMFYNSTNSIMCYCNVYGDDLKIDGSSASCF